MWIVRLALNKPYTFAVMALLIVILGGLAATTTPTDVFPNIDIPVISVVWIYNGLATPDMEAQITTFSEFSISFAVSNIKNIESQTYNGIAILKIYFHPEVDIATAQAQVTASCQTILRRMPAGTNPPLIVRYNASSVPIIQMALTSDTMTESQLYDWGIYKIRQQVSVIQGTTLPLPAGGAPRQIIVDLKPDSMRSYGISAQEVSQALSAQNIVLPTGTAKIGDRDYVVSLNSSPDVILALNDVPVKRIEGQTIFMRDVANVHDGNQVQTSIVRRDGKRGVLLTLLKNGNASTLTIAEKVKALLPSLRAAAPPGMNIDIVLDQSSFVSGAINGVFLEGAIAATLTALMILIFLGSWRSTLIVAVSIPLSILVALIALKALGYTINVMTLGGLSLAVGILVDDATVEIENIHRNMAMGKPLRQAILDGAEQIAVPAFVSTLAIAIVFISVVFLDGAAKYLFTPMALAVGISVMASYLLSRTVIPMMVMYLLVKEGAEIAAHGHHIPRGAFGMLHNRFNAAFENFADGYMKVLAAALKRKKIAFAAFGLMLVSGGLLLPHVGRDFFPKVDAGQIRLHVNAPAGTRIEETERWFSRVEEVVREVIPDDERKGILDNIGLPDGINLGVTDTTTLSTADGEILISLTEDHKRSSAEYIARLREVLPERFPELDFYFQPADIVNQILNFGIPSPIDVQVAGMDRAKTYAAAREIETRLRSIRGIADVHLHQVLSAPRLHVNINRSRAMDAGLTQRDVAQTVLVTTSTSFTVAPNYWADPLTGMNYPVVVQTPKREIASVEDLKASAVAVSPGLGRPQLLGDMADIERRTSPVIANHSNVQPTFNVRADVQGRDLGSVGDEINRIVNEYRTQLPPGSSITLRGQIESMRSSFVRLGLGLIFAAMLVYFLMVVNFQSWLDPFIILTALPGAMVGIVWMLYATGTTFSVPSLMGSIMTVGVATANSILMVTFANSRRVEGADSTQSALDAGRTRLRPVIMTALAMIIGMIPMSLGLGEGGEQNAPLGRAVIGGLLLATVCTLLFVPVVYSILRRNSVPLHHAG